MFPEPNTSGDIGEMSIVRSNEVRSTMSLSPMRTVASTTASGRRSGGHRRGEDRRRGGWVLHLAGADAAGIDGDDPVRCHADPHRAPDEIGHHLGLIHVDFVFLDGEVPLDRRCVPDWISFLPGRVMVNVVSAAASVASVSATVMIGGGQADDAEVPPVVRRRGAAQADDVADPQTGGDPRTRPRRRWWAACRSPGRSPSW